MRAKRTSRTILRIAYDRVVRRLALLVLTACGNPTGLTIEVLVEPGTRVELYAGEYCGEDCPGAVSPPNLTLKRITNAYLTFEGEVAPEVANADGVAGFRIVSDYDTHLGTILIVATKGDGTIWTSSFYDVEIRAGDGMRWRVDNLVKTEPLIDVLGQAPPAGARRIKIWNEPGATTPGCVLVEDWTAGVEPFRDLLVPNYDTDCDALMTECAPWTFHATLAPPTIETSNCVVGDLTTGTCHLAGPQCSEVGQQGDHCMELTEEYCVPSALCACQNLTDPNMCLASTIDVGLRDAVEPMPHLKCVIELDDGGQACSSEPSSPMAASICRTAAPSAPRFAWPPS